MATPEKTEFSPDARRLPSLHKSSIAGTLSRIAGKRKQNDNERKPEIS
jgi:hypothetical protein